MYIADFLYIDDSGAKQQAIANLKTLQDIVGEDNVTVIAFTGKKEIDSGNVITFRGYSNLILLFLNSLLGYTTFTNKKIEDIIVNNYLNNEYEAVFIANSFYGSLAKKIKLHYPEIRLISYYVDVKQSLCRQWIANSSLMKRPLFKAMMKNERINQEYCDVNLTLNKRESALFKSYYGYEPTAELGIYLDIDKNSFIQSESIVGEGVLEVLFVGAYYYPNVNGILWFINEVMPLLKVPISLTVVGSGMEKIKKDNDVPDEVRIYGWVESLGEYYEKADVVIEPIFEGGGMKVKTAEAFGYGKAVVGTTESFVGYIENISSDYLNNILYLCDKKEEFIVALEDIKSRKRVKKYNPEIRSIFEKYYSTESAHNTIKSILKK